MSSTAPNPCAREALKVILQDEFAGVLRSLAIASGIEVSVMCRLATGKRAWQPSHLQRILPVLKPNSQQLLVRALVQDFLGVEASRILRRALRIPSDQ